MRPVIAASRRGAKFIEALAKRYGTAARISVGLILTCLAGIATAQNYPSRPVRIVVPYSAGGITDLIARSIAQDLNKVWTQPVIIENRPGAGTIVAANYVAKAIPDGYTILMASDPTLSINQYLYSKLPYDPEHDFAPVINLLQIVNVLVASPTLAADTPRQFVALAKSKPGELTYGTFGQGTSVHLFTEELSARTGIRLNHIPYKGVADLLPALMAGQIDVAFTAIQPVLPHIGSGKLKALAYAGARRAGSLPNVPTVAETIAPGFGARTWFGFVVPAATPRPIVNKIAADISRIISTKEFDEKFVIGTGSELLNLGPDSYTEFLQRDRAGYAIRAKAVNVKLD